MKLLVNGKIKKLTIIDKNGIEWSSDLIGNNTDWSNYETDEDTELKIVDEDFFDWWKEYIENYTADEAEMDDLAAEYDLDVSDIKLRIADEMDGRDMEQEHDIKQSVFAEIRKEELLKLIESTLEKAIEQVEEVCDDIGTGKALDLLAKIKEATGEATIKALDKELTEFYESLPDPSRLDGTPIIARFLNCIFEIKIG